MRQQLVGHFGSIKGLKVIEIGAGAGTYSAIMAKEGAEVTVLDYSAKSLERSREFFSRMGLEAEYVQADALALPSSALSAYDVSMSFGLAEHFTGENRLQVIRAHFSLIEEHGLTFISVPNKYNFPYRLYKFLAEAKGSWLVEEYPFSRAELRNVCRQIGVKEYSFFGDSLFWSLNWLYWLTYKINPIVICRRYFNIPEKYDLNSISHENGTFLDQYLSYAIVLCAKKKGLLGEGR
jgi:cyclopropane fatty-acyl-phospholipid synthase-like methyltransferase